MEQSRGAIERGMIRTVSEEGYAIASLDRDGIETPPLKPLSGGVYRQGDRVYFFYFPDGTGRILCLI